MIQVHYALEVPAMLVKSERIHNALVKRVFRTVIEHHHERRIPRHFQQSAHGRYGYADRSKRYRFAKQKRYGSSIDLVRTGRTRRQMISQRQLTLGGQASTSGLKATLRLRFPFPGGTGRVRNSAGRQKVTIEQMAREIETIAADEMREIQQQIHDGYVVLVETDTSSRQRIKVT